MSRILTTGILNQRNGDDLLLNLYPGAGFAYSLRRLRRGVTRVVRVRREIDNAESDFTPEQILDGTLVTWCSGEAGYVTAWYNQSGTVDTAVMAVTTQQGRIVSDTGVLETWFGKPSINTRPIGSQTWLTRGAAIPGTGTAYFIVGRSGFGGVNRGFGAWGQITTSLGVVFGDTINSSVSNQTTNMLLTCWSNGSNGEIRVNTIDGAADAVITTGLTSGTILSRAASAAGGSFFVSEVIGYPSSQEANIQAIETDINDYYSILGVLDFYPGADVAYGLIRLSSQVNAVIRVRRSSDSAELDFSADELSNGTLAAWVGVGNDGFISAWYDQSGSNRNATQAVITRQYTIVQNGVVVIDGGLPAALANQNSGYTIPTLGTGLGDFTMTAVANSTSQVGFENVLFIMTGYSFNRGGAGIRVTTQNRQVTMLNIANPIRGICTAISNNTTTTVRGRSNGIQRTINTTGDGTTGRGIGQLGNHTGNIGWIGYVQVAIGWPSDMSTNALDIETKLNKYFNIF